MPYIGGMNNVRIAEVFDLDRRPARVSGRQPVSRPRLSQRRPHRARLSRADGSRSLADPDRKLTDIPALGKDLADKIATLCAGEPAADARGAQAQVPQSC